MNKHIVTTIDEYLNEKLLLIRGVGKNNSGNVDLFGVGLYLTDDINVAKFYGDTIKEYTINGKIFDTTKEFTSTELKKFFSSLDVVLNTNVGTIYLKQIIDYNDGKLPKNTDIDYISVSWGLDSTFEFQQVLKKNNLLTNNFNSYANVCTAMNLALKKMGYVGLKYSTTEIEDLDDNGLGDKNAYLIFDIASINQKVLEENTNYAIKTYGDISKIIKTGRRVLVTNHYGNTRTFFIDENGIPMSQHNKSKSSMLYGLNDDNDIAIDTTSTITII